jgi:hypothetical protein
MTANQIEPLFHGFVRFLFAYPTHKKKKHLSGATYEIVVTYREFCRVIKFVITSSVKGVHNDGLHPKTKQQQQKFFPPPRVIQLLQTF